MEYGLLIAEGEESGYQVIGAVSSLAEARSMMHGYMHNAQEYDMLAPYEFVVIRRDWNGFYTKREVLSAA